MILRANDIKIVSVMKKNCEGCAFRVKNECKLFQNRSTKTNKTVIFDDIYFTSWFKDDKCFSRKTPSEYYMMIKEIEDHTLTINKNSYII